METWKSLKGIVINGDFYEVSTQGNVRNVKPGRKIRVMKPSYDKDGYERVDFFLNGKGKTYRVHRLVAFAFIPQIEGKTLINHKDGVKTNNTVENLEWVNNSENILHAYDNGFADREKARRNFAALGRKYGAQRGRDLAKPVAQYDLSGNLVAVFESQIEASRQTGIPNNVISWQCNRESKPKKRSFYFRYADKKSGVS